MKLHQVIAIASLAVLLLVMELLLAGGDGHDKTPWAGIVGFYLLFGFFGCLLLIGFAKLLGHYWLQRREDYYDRDGEDG